MSEYDLYCPICQKILTPINIEDFESGAHDGLIYAHDDIVHGDDDLEALFYGVN